MISIVTVTNKQDHNIYRNIFNNYLTQTYKKRELILIINRSNIDKEDIFYRHTTTYNNDGIDIYRNILKDILEEQKASKIEQDDILNNVRIYKFPVNTLGDCLNKSALLAKGEYWAKFDDDDKYGAKYLENSLIYLLKSGADIVGKRRIFVEDKQTRSLYLTNSRNLARPPNHKFTDFIRGPTFFCKRSFVLQIGFPHKNEGEDTEFLQRCNKMRRKIYTSDENDFVYIRNSQIGQTSRLSIDKILGSNYTKLK